MYDKQWIGGLIETVEWLFLHYSTNPSDMLIVDYEKDIFSILYMKPCIPNTRVHDWDLADEYWKTQ